MTLSDFLTQHDLAAFIEAFEAQGVGVADLAHVTDEDLRSLVGMTNFADRLRFKAAVAGLSAPSSSMLTGATRVAGVPASSLSGATRVGGSEPLADAPDALPERLGSYRVLGVLGTGGMGTVVRARHTEEAWAAQQGGDVAIKLIHPHIATDPEFRGRFMAEAALGRKVHHIGFVPTYDVIAEGPWLGTVMSFITGEPLTSKVVAGGLSVEAVAALLQPIAEALDYLHAHGIVHRDLKPANIIVRPDGRPVVLDLGIAKDSTALENHTRAMTAMGTSAWMAPEQADAKKVDGAADRYALGLIAYALLAGRLPWNEGTSEARMLSNKLIGQLAPLGEVRFGLEEHVVTAVMKMLRVEPDARFGSCVEFVAALQIAPTMPVVAAVVPVVAAAVPVVAATVPVVEPVSLADPTPAKSAGLWVGVAVACVLAAAVAGLVWLSAAKEPDVVPIAASPGLSAVTITSEPAGAQVYLGAVPQGQTPLSLSLPYGLTAIRVEQSGYNSETHTMNIGSATVLEHFKLTAVEGERRNSGHAGKPSVRSPSPKPPRAEGGGSSAVQGFQPLKGGDTPRLVPAAPQKPNASQKPNKKK